MTTMLPDRHEMWFALEGEIHEAEERKAQLYDEIKALWEDMQYDLRLKDDTPILKPDAPDTLYYAPKLVPSTAQMEHIMLTLEKRLVRLKEAYIEYRGLFERSAQIRRDLRDFESKMVESRVNDTRA